MCQSQILMILGHGFPQVSLGMLPSKHFGGDFYVSQTLWSWLRALQLLPWAFFLAWQ